MASNNMQCGICDEEYTDGEKKPLMLPCGHSYCQPCLQQIATSSALLKPKCGQKCPTCRCEWTGDINNLTVCYQLMPNTGSSSSTANGHKTPENGLCQTHTFMLLFRCTECEVNACKMCVVQSHAGCSLTLLKYTDCQKHKFISAFKQMQLKLQKVKDISQESKGAVGENLNIIQKFGNVIQNVETELVDEENKISAVDEKFTTNLESIYSRLAELGDGSEEYDLGGVEKDRLLMYKLEEDLKQNVEAKDLPLCDFAKIWMQKKGRPALTDYMTELCQPTEKFGPNKDWEITNDAEACEAMLTILQFNQKPNNIVRIQSNEKKPLKIGLCFLPCMAKEAQELQLVLSDSFWSSDAFAFDTERVSCILDHKEALKVTKFFGRLDYQSITKLPRVKIFGQKIQELDDLTAVNNGLCALPTLTELHVSVPQTHDPVQLGALHVNFYNIKSCCIHFTSLVDDKLIWMQQIIAKLIPSFTNNVRIKELYLHRCRLSMGGMEVLLGLVHGCQITSVVQITRNAFTSMQVQKLAKLYISYGITLLSHENSVVN